MKQQYRASLNGDNIGHGEIHYTDGEGLTQVELIPAFTPLVRNSDEAVDEFKVRMTNHVLRHGHAYRQCQIVEVKWTAPLGYHQGYNFMPVKHSIPTFVKSA